MLIYNCILKKFNFSALVKYFKISADAQTVKEISKVTVFLQRHFKVYSKFLFQRVVNYGPFGKKSIEKL